MRIDLPTGTLTSEAHCVYDKMGVFIDAAGRETDDWREAEFLVVDLSDRRKLRVSVRDGEEIVA